MAGNLEGLYSWCIVVGTIAGMPCQMHDIWPLPIAADSLVNAPWAPGIMTNNFAPAGMAPQAAHTARGHALAEDEAP